MVETLSVLQVGERLGCSKRRVFQLLADGTLDRAPRYGRQIRIYAASVDKALMPAAVKRRKPRAPVAPDMLTIEDIPL